MLTGNVISGFKTNIFNGPSGTVTHGAVTVATSFVVVHASEPSIVSGGAGSEKAAGAGLAGGRTATTFSYSVTVGQNSIASMFYEIIT